MRITGRLILSVGLCLGVAGNVLAKGELKDPIHAGDLPTFNKEAAAVRDDMKAGGRYEFLSASDRARVDEGINSLAALFAKYSSVPAMPEPVRAQWLTAQESVNGILTHNDAQRLVCESRAPTGSNLMRSTCRTVGEIERERRDSQRYLQQRQAMPQFKSKSELKVGN